MCPVTPLSSVSAVFLVSQVSPLSPVSTTSLVSLVSLVWVLCPLCPLRHLYPLCLMWVLCPVYSLCPPCPLCLLVSYVASVAPEVPVAHVCGKSLLFLCSRRGDLVWILSDGYDRRSIYGFEIFDFWIFWLRKFNSILFWY